MIKEFDQKLLQKVIELCQALIPAKDRKIVLMEVCGTHTTAISKSGLRSLLSPYLELLSGPGCPVCVTDQDDIDRIVELTRHPQVVVATFGDMIRVPGTHSSLEKERAKGAAVEIFYSPHEAVTYAENHPDKEIVFLGVGFETSAPAIAMSMITAQDRKINNYSVLSFHKLVPPAMRVLLNDPEFSVDGFILPGHVAAIIGRKAFDFISTEYRLPAVIAGFESLDILDAIYILLHQLKDKRAQTLIGYTRLVHEEGNRLAQEIMERCFEPVDDVWRGFGPIPHSGLSIRKEFARFDAKIKFPIKVVPSASPKGCSCGDILKGKMKPMECRLYAKACTPSTPVGPCMVSSEGACSAYYQYT